MPTSKLEKRAARKKLIQLHQLLSSKEKKVFGKATKRTIDKKTKRALARPGIKQWILNQVTPVQNLELMKQRGLL